MITKKIKLASEQVLDANTFKLPENIQCSEIHFPVLARVPARAKWHEILEEKEQFGAELRNYKRMNFSAVPPTPFRNTETEYIKKIFLDLLPALIETLDKAKLSECLSRQKCFFNGIDHIAQVLWNNNPRYPARKSENLHIFNMPWVREFLNENPRPLYPKSWLWTEEYAASLIQKTVRTYFVQREEEVQEMRDFWIKMKAESNVPEMKMNPLLSKKFAEVALDPHRSVVGPLAKQTTKQNLKN